MKFRFFLVLPIPLIGVLLQTGPQGDLTFETSSFMKATAYRNPANVSNDVSPTGAYGIINRTWEKTKTGKWYIEQQRYGFDAIGAGLAYQRQDLIDRGISIFNWGFQRQELDGSFLCHDSFHSTSFFLEAVGRATLLLQVSPFAQQYSQWIKSIKPKLLASARWMTDPKNEIPGKKSDAPFTHRFYLVAEALGLVGLINNDIALIKKSEEYINEGLARQDPTGFNPERDGYDTSYHMVGLVFAIRYYTLCADQNMRDKLTPMITKGLAWLKTRIRPDGSVDSTGNTRTGSDQEIGRNNKPKTMNYGAAYRAFAYWGMIKQDPSLEQVARRLFEFNLKK